MLVLSRSVGSKILIGESIEIEIVALRGKKVSIGVSAPTEIRIVRGEIAGTAPQNSFPGEQGHGKKKAEEERGS